MDNSTRRFIGISRSLLRVFRAIDKRLRNLHRDIHQQSEAARAAYERNTHDDRPQEVRAEVRFIDSKEREEGTYRQQQTRMQKSLRNATWCAFAAGTLYAAIAALQLWQMRKATEKAGISAEAAKSAADASEKANQTTREALVSVQRAFVFPDPIQSIAAWDTTTNRIVSVEFIFTLLNSGTTPTKNMQHHFSSKNFDKPLPNNFAFPDLWTPGVAHTPKLEFLGPRASVNLSGVTVPVDILIAAERGKTHLFIWGWARYHDVFEHTPEHIMKFCYEYKGLYGGRSISTVSPANLVEAHFDDCKIGNCQDEECK